MKPILTLVKIPETNYSNIYGWEKIHIYAFNFDGAGSALVSYDDEMEFDTQADLDLYGILCGCPGDGTRWYRPECKSDIPSFLFPGSPSIQ